jgi:hypothetical protein
MTFPGHITTLRYLETTILRFNANENSYEQGFYSRRGHLVIVMWKSRIHLNFPGEQNGKVLKDREILYNKESEGSILGWRPA